MLKRKRTTVDRRSQTADGSLPARDTSFEKKIAKAEGIMSRYRNTLRALAKAKKGDILSPEPLEGGYGPKNRGLPNSESMK